MKRRTSGRQLRMTMEAACTRVARIRSGRITTHQRTLIVEPAPRCIRGALTPARSIITPRSITMTGLAGSPAASIQPARGSTPKQPFLIRVHVLVHAPPDVRWALHHRLRIIGVSMPDALTQRLLLTIHWRQSTRLEHACTDWPVAQIHGLSTTSRRPLSTPAGVSMLFAAALFNRVPSTTTLRRPFWKDASTPDQDAWIRLRAITSPMRTSPRRVHTMCRAACPRMQQISTLLQLWRMAAA